MDELPSNVEPFAPEVLARWMIQRYGEWADIEASSIADHFFESGQTHIGNIWQQTAKVIASIRLIKEASGGSLNDYKWDGS